MSAFGVSALTTSAISTVKTLTVKRAYIQDYTTQHTLVSIDASIRETHTIDAPPTEFPIESGQVVSDNFIIKPFVLDMEAMISDNPVSAVASVVTSAISTVLPATGIIAGGAAVAVFNALNNVKAAGGATGGTPSIANFNQFLQIIMNKRPVNVYTTLKMYNSMWLSSLKVTRSSETGNALMFNAHFVQIILVAPQTVNVAKYSNAAVSTPLANQGGSSTSASNIFGATFDNGRVSGNFQGAGNAAGPAF